MHIWPAPCIRIPLMFVQKHDMCQDMSKLKLDQTPMQLKCKFRRWEIQTQIQPTVMWPISLHAWWSNKPCGATWSASLMAQYTIWLWHHNLCLAHFDHNFIIKREINNSLILFNSAEAVAYSVCVFFFLVNGANRVWGRLVSKWAADSQMLGLWGVWWTSLHY